MISFTTTSPSGRTKKSMRAIPSHSVATNDSTASSRTRCVRLRRDARRDRRAPSRPRRTSPSSRTSRRARRSRRRPTRSGRGFRARRTRPRRRRRPPRSAPCRRGGARARRRRRARSSSCTFEMPTDEPRRAGFTNTGYVEAGASSASPSRSVTLRATGIPRSRSTALKRSLSMHSADAATPAPTYGTPASSSSPCTVPSSPNGPCRIGSTTSTSPSVAAGAESRDDRERLGRCVARASSPRVAAASSQRPLSVDLDDDGLVALGIERRRRPTAPTRPRSRARSSGRPRAPPRERVRLTGSSSSSRRSGRRRA